MIKHLRSALPSAMSLFLPLLVFVFSLPIIQTTGELHPSCLV